MHDKLRKVACVVGILSICIATGITLDYVILKLIQKYELIFEKYEWMSPAITCLGFILGLCIGEYA